MIKFRNSEKIYNLKVEIITWRSVIQLSGEELPTEFSDFDVINDEGTVIDYFEGFNIVYDSGDGYVQLTNDNNTYYNYLICNKDNYVTDISIETAKRNDAYLYQSGQGKVYKCFSMNLLNEDNFALYKIENNKLIETTEEERNVYHQKCETEKLLAAKNDKINELSKTCNNMIELGININDEQFSYTLTDQNNISAAVLLSQQTGMSVPYHSNGNTCRLMSLEELMTVYVYQQMNLMHHQTYYNQLKLYVQNELTDIESVSNVTYGDELTGIYLDTYNAMMEQSKNLASAYTTQVEIE